MAKITRPNESQEQGGARIGLGLAATAGQGAVAIGQTVAQVGKIFQNSDRQLSLAKQMASFIDSEGRKLFNQSKKAHQSAVVLNKLTSAQEEFIKASFKRSRQTVDKNGNPTFTTLHEDIGKIGSDILNKHLKGIGDPEIANQFSLRFNRYVASQKMSALKKGLRQQVSFAQSSLDKGLATLIQQGSSDNFEQVGEYEAQGLESIDNALSSGIIDSTTHNRMRQEFSIIIREGAIRNSIKNNREEAVNALSLSVEELGLPEEKVKSLKAELDAANRADEIAVKKAEQIQAIDEEASEASLIEDVQAKIKADAIREDEILQLQGKLKPKTYKQIRRDFIRAAKARQKDRNQVQGMLNRISSGDDLFDVKPKDINGLFEYLVAQREDETGQRASLEEEAKLAAIIPREVTNFSRKLEQVLKFGDINRAKDAVAAYTYIQDNEKPTLSSGFDKDAVYIAERAQRLSIKGGMSFESALQSARDSIINLTEEGKGLKLSEFNSISDFKTSNLRNTALEELGLEPFLSSDATINSDALITYKELVKEGYLIDGDLDSAKAFAKEMINKTHGISEVSGEKQFMFAPPEKLTGLNTEELRESILQDTKAVFPEGINAETIGIDPGAELQFNSRGQPSWVLTHEVKLGDDSIRMPIIDNKTGLPVKWSPDMKAIRTRKREALKQERQEILTGVQGPVIPEEGGVR